MRRPPATLWPILKRLAIPVVAVLIAVAMAASLARHGGPMLKAASGLATGSLAVALVLALVYRVVNAMGWGLILQSLGEPARLVPSARVWLASEACRWLPGGLWSFGSRAVLASRLGLAGPTVAASLALELLVTVVAWVAVAALGATSLRLPYRIGPETPRTVAVWAACLIAVATFLVVLVLRSPRLRERIGSLLVRIAALRKAGINRAGIVKSFAFYVLMGAFNGTALLMLVRSVPGGSSCPASAVLAANAISWLVGFFAIFAPGGLVVREACLAALLSRWIGPEPAIALALAWRLIQIAAEAICFLAVVAWGQPDSLGTPSVASDPRLSTRLGVLPKPVTQATNA